MLAPGVPEVLAYVGAGHARGKVVIAIGPPDPNDGSMAARTTSRPVSIPMDVRRRYIDSPCRSTTGPVPSKSMSTE